MKMFICLSFAIFLGIIGLIMWAGYPWSLSAKQHHPEIITVEPDGMVSFEENPSVIKIMTWNLGFLYGEGSEGPGYEFREKKIYEEKLSQLAQFIEEWNPDVICLQEIDFDSFRSHGMNQAQYIAKKAGYPYVAEALSWDAHYIPFPYWPISRHFARVKSGGAIISKYPLMDHEVNLLAKPISQPWWYNIFYLHRYFQKVTIEMGDKKFKIINLHLEAFDKKERQDQIELLSQKVLKENIDFVTGDFNMLMSSATKRSKFYNDDNYENDFSYEKALKMNLSEVIPDDIYAKNESLYFTYPASHPDRRLDYIFYKPELKMMKAEVVPSALSDHLPLRASFQIDSPKFNLYSQ